MSNSPSRFIFSLTAGRTGTHFLTALLKDSLRDAEVHHEILTFQSFGVDTPDVSHMTLFNSRGNVDKVQQFWASKMERILASQASTYVETSHLLMKAGLVENLGPLLAHGDVHLIELRRDPVKTVMSYLRDHHFSNRGMWWMWYLDPAYPNKIVEPGQLAEMGTEGACIWYLLEIEARAEYYRLLLADEPRVHVHRVELSSLNSLEGVAALHTQLGLEEPVSGFQLPPPQAPSRGLSKLPQDLQGQLAQFIARLNANPAEMAAKFYASGRRLEDPSRERAAVA